MISLSRKVVIITVSSYLLWKVCQRIKRIYIHYKFYRSVQIVGLFSIKPPKDRFSFFTESAKKFKNYLYLPIWNVTQLNIFLLHPKAFELVYNNKTAITKNYINAIEWIGDGLICSTGNKWKTHRRSLTNVFHKDNLNGFLSNFNHHAEVLVQKIKSFNGAKFDFYNLAAEILFKSLLSTLMGLDEDCEYITEEMKLDHLQTVRALTKLTFLYAHDKDTYGSFLSSFLSSHKAFRKAIYKSDHFTNCVLQERLSIFKKNMEAGIDPKVKCLIDILLHLKYQEEIFTEEDVLSELKNFLFAGFDTSTSTLTWIMHLLATNIDVQMKLRNEIKSSTIMEKGQLNISSIDDLNLFPYLDNVIKESQRLMSSVPATSRYVDESTKLRLLKPDRLNVAQPKENDFTDEVPVGTRVSLPYFCLHRNPTIWGVDADTFRPDRFNVDEVKTRHPYAFVPFSAGQRNCIGQKFALMEMKLFLLRIISQFEFTTEQNVDDCKAFVGVTLDPTAGVILEAREI